MSREDSSKFKKANTRRSRFLKSSEWISLSYRWTTIQAPSKLTLTLKMLTTGLSRCLTSSTRISGRVKTSWMAQALPLWWALMSRSQLYLPSAKINIKHKSNHSKGTCQFWLHCRRLSYLIIHLLLISVARLINNQKLLKLIFQERKETSDRKMKLMT